MKTIMFFASLLTIPFCYLLAIIPASILMAILDTNSLWPVWIITAILYLIGLRTLLSLVKS